MEGRGISDRAGVEPWIHRYVFYIHHWTSPNLCTDKLVREIYSGLLVQGDFSKQYSVLFGHLRSTEQLSVVEAIFRDIEKSYFTFQRNDVSNEVVNGVAALCSIILRGHTNLQAQLVDSLSKGQGGSIQTTGLRRAVLATFAHQQGNLKYWIV